jgi:hypothetical protein
MHAYCVCVLLVTEAELVFEFCLNTGFYFDGVAKFGKSTISFMSIYLHGTTRPNWMDFH